MQILPIKIQCYKNYNGKTCNSNSINTYNKNFLIQSSGSTNRYNLNVTPFLGKPGYEDFILKINKYYGSNALYDVIMNSICEENIIGSGVEGIVYKIPRIKNYLIKISKNIFEGKKSIPNNVLEPVSNIFRKYNFGQSIAQNNLGLAILRKVNGETYGISNWLGKILGEEISATEAKAFLCQLQKVSTSPISEYVNFAKKLKFLNEKTPYRMDLFSPSNLLITKDKKLNPIDLWKKDDFVEISERNNDVQDMISLLTDSLMHKQIYDKLDDLNQKEMIIATKTIVQKCKEAAITVDLKTASVSLEEAFVRLDRHFTELGKTIGFDKKYLNFLEMYKDILG